MIPKDRTFYLEAAKEERLRKGTISRKKLAIYFKNYKRVLDEDIDKIIGRCGHSDQVEREFKIS